MKKYWLVSAVCLAACSGPDVSTGEMADASAAPPVISVSNAMINPPMAGRDVAAGYFQIVSEGGSDRLIAATTPDADTIEIHTHINEDGVMKMREVDGVDLLEGETVTFERGGLHLMIFGADFADNQGSASVTLDFETADDLTLMIPIGDGMSGGDAHASPHEGHGDHGTDEGEN